jgi:hypothetical protein
MRGGYYPRQINPVKALSCRVKNASGEPAPANRSLKSAKSINYQRLILTMQVMRYSDTANLSLAHEEGSTTRKQMLFMPIPPFGWFCLFLVMRRQTK